MVYTVGSPTVNIMVQWCYTLAMWLKSFAAVYGIAKVLLRMAKCTGGVGEHVGEFKICYQFHHAKINTRQLPPPADLA